MICIVNIIFFLSLEKISEVKMYITVETTILRLI